MQFIVKILDFLVASNVYVSLGVVSLTFLSLDIRHDKYAFAKSASITFDVEEKTILNYLCKCENKYDLTASLFLENSLHKMSTYLSKNTLKALLNLVKCF